MCSWTYLRLFKASQVENPADLQNPTEIVYLPTYHAFIYERHTGHLKQSVTSLYLRAKVSEILGIEKEYSVTDSESVRLPRKC
jgi:hypothetical protein